MMTKYDIFKNSAFAVQSGIVKDKIGTVSYVVRKYQDIELVNLTKKENKDLNTPRNIIKNKIKITKNNNPECFYDTFSKESVYREGDITTDRTSNVYKIRIDNNLSILEIRNNDPLYLVGLDTPEYLVLQSIAISQSEANTIKSLSDTNFIKDTPVYFFLMLVNGKYLKVTRSGERPYWYINLGISGTSNSSEKQLHEIDTGITLYSLDERNWLSSAYSIGAFGKITGVVWNNKIVPEPVENNPFQPSFWSNGNNGLKERLNTIITEADNLPVANDNKGKRLLDTAIRDYIYQGDIEKITFEMAFRLPFFMEDITKTPYTKLKNNRDNNPYYTKFDDWFGYANGLRTLAGYSDANLLSRTGHKNSFTDAIQNAQDHLNLYKIFNIKRNNVLAKYHIPAYFAKVLSEENSIVESGRGSFDGYFTIPKSGIWIRNDSTARTNAKAEIKDLEKFKNDGKISLDTYNKLIAGSIWWGELIAGKQCPENGYYVIREIIDNTVKYFIYNKFWGNSAYDNDKNESVVQYEKKKKKGVWVEVKDKPISNSYWAGDSGLTISFGYDMGGKSISKDYTLPSSNPDHDTTFLYITGLSDKLTSFQESIIKKGFGIKRDKAVALYYTFFDTVFKNNNVTVNFDYAVGHIFPFAKKNYLYLGISTQEGLRSDLFDYFKVYKSEAGIEFYDGGIQYLNEIEKYLFGTQLYNAGEYSLKVKNRPKAKYLLHAFNCHDIRWAKYFFKTISSSYRKNDIVKELDRNISFAHYNIKQETL
jgi:hypothetical protein